MKLYLVQHAEAKREEEDPARDLTDKGRRDVQKVADLLGKLNLTVGQIFHSGKTRAQSTANLIAASLKPPPPVLAAPGLAPLDSPGIWAERIEQMDEDIMLVGHLPHLGKLVARLIIGDEQKSLVNFKMAGVLRLGRNETKQWAVDWLIIPELIN
jgi:phosphohistidine phosphatase